MNARLRVVGVLTVASLALAVPALASGWGANGAGAAAAGAGSVNAVQSGSINVQAVGSTELDVTVTATPSGGATPTGYQITRGNTTICASVTLNQVCADKNLSPSTFYTYSVYSRIGSNWTSSAAQQSGTTNAATSALNVNISFPVSGGTYSNNNNNGNQWADAISGSASGGSGTVTVTVYVKRADNKYWNGTGWVTSSTDLYLATTGTASSWSLSLTRASALNGSGGDTSYTVGAKATDAASTSKTTSATFTYSKS